MHRHHLRLRRFCKNVRRVDGVVLPCCGQQFVELKLERICMSCSDAPESPARIVMRGCIASCCVHHSEWPTKNFKSTVMSQLRCTARQLQRLITRCTCQASWLHPACNCCLPTYLIKLLWI